MNKKLLIVIAVVAGLIAMFLVQRHVDNLVGETVTVYKAKKGAEAGTVLGSNVEPITLPAGLFPDILDEAPKSDLLEYIKSTPLRAGVSAGDILLYRHFDAAVDQGVLPAIPAGKKAISIAVDQTSAVSFFIQPGDLVDVLGTYATREELDIIDGVAAAPAISTKPILQAVEVLAVGDSYRPAQRQRLEPYSSVTLLVSMEEAAKLIFARDFYSSTMTLVLRGKDDTNVLPEPLSVGVDTDNFDDIGNEPSKKSNSMPAN